MTFSRLHITVFLALATLVWALVLIYQGTPITNAHLAPFSLVVGFLVLIGVAFEHVLWRLPILHGWFVRRPDLRGTWRVELKSDSTDANSGLGIDPIEAFVGVSQTLSRLQMHLMTVESDSWFIAERIDPSPKGTGYQIAAVYTNHPDLHLRGKRSQIHLGAIVLYTHGASQARPDSLCGEYWTDRATKGTMTFICRAGNLYSRFQDAKNAFSNVKL